MKLYATGVASRFNKPDGWLRRDDKVVLLMKKIDELSGDDDHQSSGAMNHKTPDHGNLQWQPTYWVLASFIPFMFYAFDAVMRTSYPETQAPNVSLTLQLSVMLGFYALWMLVPRIIWYNAVQSVQHNSDDLKKLMTQLIVVGVILCAFHLLILTVILRYFYSVPGWGLRELIYSYGEVCLANAAIWLMAYGIAAALIMYRIHSSKPKIQLQSRYEVRQNGKTWSFPFDEIFWIKAAGNYAELHTIRGIMLVRKSLTQIITEVVGGSFIQSHRSALVNGKHVVAIKQQSDGSGYLVELSNNEFAPLSRRNHAHFREALRTIG